MEPALGTGLYTFKDAANLLGVEHSLIRTWFLGKKQQRRVLSPDFAPAFGRNVISFLDLTDAFVVSALRKAGFSMPLLRLCYNNLQEILRTEHSFSHEGLRTGGKGLFLKIRRGDKELLFELANKHQVIEKLLGPNLQRIRYDEHTQLAARWNVLPDRVYLDPEVNFGQPTVVGCGIPAHVLYESWMANNENASTVANWYGVKPAHVEDAIAFHKRAA